MLSRWEPPHLLCNNAGVGGGWTPLWAATRKDWDWVLGVNLTRINAAARNRPPHMIEEGRLPLENMEVFEAMDSRHADIGMRPEAVADMVVEAVEQDRFYILTHPVVVDAVMRCAEAMADGRTPPAPIAPELS